MSETSDMPTVDDSTVYGFEKLIQKVEFENRQLLRKIDDVITYISIFGQEMKQKEEDIASMTDDTNKLKEELRTMDEQMMGFRRSSDSLTRARKQLKIYEMEQEKTLTGLSKDKNSDQRVHAAILQNYTLMRNDFNEKYQSMAQFRKLAELQAKLAEKREKMAAAKLRESRLRRLLKLEDSSEAVDFGDWTLFVVKIAEFKRGTRTFEVRIKEAHRRTKELLDVMEHGEIDAVKDQLSQMIVDSDPEDRAEETMETDADTEQQASSQQRKGPEQKSPSMQEERQRSSPSGQPRTQAHLAVRPQQEACLPEESLGESCHADYHRQESALPDYKYMKSYNHEDNKRQMYLQESLCSEGKEVEPHGRVKHGDKSSGEKENKDGSDREEESMEAVSTEEEERQEELERQPEDGGMTNACPHQVRTLLARRHPHKDIPPNGGPCRQQGRDTWSKDVSSTDTFSAVSRFTLQRAPIPVAASTRTHSISSATAASSSPPRVWRQVQPTVRAGLQTTAKDRVMQPETPAVQITAPDLTIVAVPSLVQQEGVKINSSASLSGHGRPIFRNPGKAAVDEDHMASRSCFPGEPGAISSGQAGHQCTYVSNQAPNREAEGSRASPIKYSSQPEPSRTAGSTSPHEEHTLVKTQENCTVASKIPLVLAVVPEAETDVGRTDSDEDIPVIQQPSAIQGLCRFLDPEHSFPDVRPQEFITEDAKKDEQNLLFSRQSKEILDSPVFSNEMDVNTSSRDSLDNKEDSKSFKMPPPPEHMSSLSRLHPFTPSSPASAYMAITRSSPFLQSWPDAASSASWNKACPRPVEPNPAINSAWDRPISTEGLSVSPTQSGYTRSSAQINFVARNIQDAFGRRHIQSLFSRNDFSSESQAQNSFTRSNVQGGFPLKHVQDAFGRNLMQKDFCRGNASSVNQVQGDIDMRNMQDGSQICSMQGSRGNGSTSSGIHVQDSCNTSYLLSAKVGTESINSLPCIDQTQVHIIHSTAPSQPKELSVSGLSMADTSADASSDSVRATSVCTEKSTAVPFEDTSGISVPWAAADITCNETSSGPLNVAAFAVPTPSVVSVKSQVSSGPAEVVAKSPDSGNIVESPSRSAQGRLVQCLYEPAADGEKARLQVCEAWEGRQGRQGCEAEEGRQGRQGCEAEEGRQGRQVCEAEEGRQGRQVCEAEEGWQGKQVHKAEEGRQGRQVYKAEEERRGRQVYKAEEGRRGRQVYKAEEGRQGRQVYKAEEGRQGRQVCEAEEGRQGRQVYKAEEGRQGRQVCEAEEGWQGRQVCEAEDGRQGRQVCETEEERRGRQGTTSRPQRERRPRSQEDAQECGTPCSVSPDQDWGSPLNACTPEKGALRHVSPFASSGRNNDSSEEPKCSPFDFETYKETLNKLKAFSPVPVTFTHRPMFDALDKDADENPEDVSPGQGFSFPFMGSIFNEEGDHGKSSSSPVLVQSPPQDKTASSSFFLLGGQEDSQKEPGDKDTLFNFASSPTGGEERGDFLGVLTEAGGQDQASYSGGEDSSFLFNLGSATSSSSFSFNFSSPISSPSH